MEITAPLPAQLVGSALVCSTRWIRFLSYHWLASSAWVHVAECGSPGEEVVALDDLSQGEKNWLFYGGYRPAWWLFKLLWK